MVISSLSSGEFKAIGYIIPELTHGQIVVVLSCMQGGFVSGNMLDAETLPFDNQLMPCAGAVHMKF